MKPMRWLAVAVSLGFAALPTHSQSQTAGSITLASSSATVTSFGGSSRVISAETGIVDRDIVTTALNGTATLESTSGWSATLGEKTCASVKTEIVMGGPSPVFARVLRLLSGSLTWKVNRGAVAWLSTPCGMLKASDTTAMKVSFADGTLTVETEGGSVDLSGGTATVTLKGGQVVRVHYSKLTGAFSFEVVEDNGNAIDIEVGKTTVHATKGDAFDVHVSAGGHSEVFVSKGLVQVSGPDKRMVELGPGQTEIVVGGGEGAVKGMETLTKRGAFDEMIRDSRWYNYLESQYRSGYQRSLFFENSSSIKSTVISGS